MVQKFRAKEISPLLFIILRNFNVHKQLLNVLKFVSFFCEKFTPQCKKNNLKFKDNKGIKGK